MKRVWITGYRSYELGVFNQRDPKIKVIKYCLKSHLRSLFENGELNRVVSGTQFSVEQWALEATIELQKDYPVNVSMMVLYQEFFNRWNEDNRNHFLSLKEQADFSGSTSNSPYQNPVQLRNYQNFMVQYTDSAIMIYDPEHPGKSRYDFELIQRYQQERDYDLNLIDFYSLEDIANEYVEVHKPDYFN